MSSYSGPPSTRADERLRAVAFRGIYEGHIQYVWNTLRYLGVPDADIEDVAQEVFVTVYRHVDRIDTIRSMRGWLFGIAYRAASNNRRLAKYHREDYSRDLGEEQSERPTAEELVGGRQDADLVLQVLQSIGLDRRALLVMHDMDGIPIPEAAEALSIGTNTAYTRLRLARKDFKTAMSRALLRRGAT